MTYTDDEAKADFAKTSFMLQVVVSVFEASLFNFGKEVELIEVADDEQCFVGVPDADDELLQEMEFQINKNFRRKDGRPTCDIQSLEFKILRFYGTKTADLAFPI